MKLIFIQNPFTQTSSRLSSSCAPLAEHNIKFNNFSVRPDVHLRVVRWMMVVVLVVMMMHTQDEDDIMGQTHQIRFLQQRFKLSSMAHELLTVA